VFTHNWYHNNKKKNQRKQYKQTGFIKSTLNTKKENKKKIVQFCAVWEYCVIRADSNSFIMARHITPNFVILVYPMCVFAILNLTLASSSFVLSPSSISLSRATETHSLAKVEARFIELTEEWRAARLLRGGGGKEAARDSQMEREEDSVMNHRKHERGCEKEYAERKSARDERETEARRERAYYLVFTRSINFSQTATRAAIICHHASLNEFNREAAQASKNSLHFTSLFLVQEWE
jgi:hypothetical protein